MLEAIPHRLMQQIARADALEHDGKLKVAERHVGADPENIPAGPTASVSTPSIAASRPTSRDALGIPGGALVTAMIYRIAGRTERKILTPHLWTLPEW